MSIGKKCIQINPNPVFVMVIPGAGLGLGKHTNARGPDKALIRHANRA